jgi:hypothetical protein
MPPAHVSAAGLNRPIVRDLAIACIYRFAEIRGVGVGVANGSCCASLLLTAPGPHGPEYRYGNSQAHLLDPNALVVGGMFNPGQHAERQAHAAAMGAPYGNHLFVELPPCPGLNGCATWANATIPGVQLWYLYPNTGTMTATHAGGTAAEMAYLNAQLP